ncbi:hypothetical protein BCR34DRAFT_608601 [Clohesyomyces aquaticus]|uniref:SpvB-domain-containing protein n=1 Tax=Clohesyomyces aquaticus TaxID=1231657 RepID=A0A1Y1Y5L0_9PLEO|nr:hypothetical protein BCR34DRAFT_608601 [Clohesyomyces aquaticus]
MERYQALFNRTSQTSDPTISGGFLRNDRARGTSLNESDGFPGNGPSGHPPSGNLAKNQDESDNNPLGASPSLPKPGGAIASMNEKFSVHPSLGTCSLAIPIPSSGLGARAGVYPTLSLTYSSGSGNGAFGIGWSLGLGSVTRKSEKGIPTYRDNEDIYMLSGTEDLVPELRYNEESSSWYPTPVSEKTINGVSYTVQRYRPRVESDFATIEKWDAVSGINSHWRVISPGNVTSTYGMTPETRISDPNEPAHVYSWLLDSVTDGNGTRLEAANKYLKSIKYGNLTSTQSPEYRGDDEQHWMFEIVLDYGDHGTISPLPEDNATWPLRKDPFSSHRSGFELRTYRLCQRVLIFHHFPDEPDVGANCLVKAMNLTYRNELPTDDPKLGNSRGSLLSQLHLTCYKRISNSLEYMEASMPPISLSYTPWKVEMLVQSLSSDQMADMPCPGDGTSSHFVDLHGEGIPGILVNDVGGNWYYKEPLGNAAYGPATPVPNMPSFSSLNSSPPRMLSQLLDIDGDGIAEFVDLTASNKGFSRIAAWEPPGKPPSPSTPPTPDGLEDLNQTWEPFVPFESFPMRDWSGSDTTWVDLTGNGTADLLVPGDMSLEWHPSKATKGLGPLQGGSFYSSGEAGLKPIFSERDNAIVVFTDMTGDGLADLVRIDNFGVSYYPNIGYGRFGKKVAMDRGPTFDSVDGWDPRRVRLADIDGTGTTDFIYLSQNGAMIFMNECGNAWSQPISLPSFPSSELDAYDWSKVEVVDLLGTGTGCLTWTSSLGPNGRKELRFINLCQGNTPNLLQTISNGFGAYTTIEYASSVKFALADKASGHRWRTLMPFAVQVVEKSFTVDKISRTYGSATNSYHHGFYDANGPSDREFRGFACVETRDTESFESLNQFAQREDAAEGIDETTHMVPVLTKTWFHVGAYLGSRGGVHSNYLSSEYYSGQKLLQDPPLPNEYSLEHGGVTAPLFSPSAEEYRQMCRTLNGTVLRQETYVEDGDPEKQSRPYVITENCYSVKAYQPSANPFESGHSWAVFRADITETVTVNSERGTNMFETLITHALCLKTNYFGHEIQKAIVAYGRRGTISTEGILSPDDINEMRRTYVTLNETEYTNSLPLKEDVLSSDIRRLPTVHEDRTYQLFNVEVPEDPNQLLYSLDEVSTLVDDSTSNPEIPFADYNGSSAGNGGIYRRLLSHARFLFRKDDLTGPLPPGVIESRVIPHEGYRKALLSDDLQSALVASGKLSSAELNRILEDEGRYIRMDQDWWIPSGKGFFSPEHLLADEELAFAKEHFFMAYRYVNPFDRPGWSTAAYVTYDKYNLLVLDSVDALGNRATAGERDLSVPDEPIKNIGLDYRILGSRLVMDPNGNMSETRFDTLGMAIGAATMGKPGEAVGDTFVDFEEEMSEEEIVRFFNNPTEPGLAADLLKGASHRGICDINAYARTKSTTEPTPAVVAIITREVHAKDPDSHSGRLYISLSYINGLCQPIQAKALVDPGQLDDEEDIEENASFAEIRWLASPWAIFNNKGLPVQLFDPFYTLTHKFEFNVRKGLPSTTFYDPLGRAICQLSADHTWGKLLHEPWSQTSWDANDTVAIPDPREDPDVGGQFRRLPDEATGEPSALYWPTWYAQRTAPTAGREEKSAAEKTMAHANTPTKYFCNAIGEVFVSARENRVVKSDGSITSEFLVSRANLDSQGMPHVFTDTLGRQIGTCIYDMAGRPLVEWDMEIGRSWNLQDIEGKVLYKWNEGGDRFSTTFDQLSRPVNTYTIRAGTTTPLLVNRFEFGENEAPDVRAEKNLRGRCSRQFDIAGVIEFQKFDFKGNVEQFQRKLVKDYKNDIDWTNVNSVDLMEPPFIIKGVYDAMDRQTETTLPDGTRINQVYDGQDQVVKVFATHPGASQPTQYLHDVQVDAKGQRNFISYGDGTGAKTFYKYDKLTLRLKSIVTKRPASQFPGDNSSTPDSSWPGVDVQNLSYYYDPIGNVTSIRDNAQQAIFFHGQRVEPSQEFVYDALYRLTEASGREHVNSTYDEYDKNVARLHHPHDGNAIRRYTEAYKYDNAGNILRMQHKGGQNGSWTREYTYDESLQTPFGQTIISNRLTSTVIGGSISNYKYDVHGNLSSIPHLSSMTWDYNDKLRSTSRQRVENGGTPEKTYYVYDGSGRRIRKVTELYAAEGATPTLKNQTIYLGTLEITDTFTSSATDPSDPATLKHRLRTIKVDDGPQRLVTISTSSDEPSSQFARYQLSNHLGSCSVELDSQFHVLSYEEYTPYGSTSYQGVSDVSLPPKLSRFISAERDDESGFYALGARYYMPWLGIFINPDPGGFAGGTNLYAYASNNPIALSDPSGLVGEPPPQYTGGDFHESGAVREEPWAGNESEGVVRGAATAAHLDVGEFLGWGTNTQGQPIPVFSYVNYAQPGTPSNAEGGGGAVGAEPGPSDAGAPAGAPGGESDVGGSAAVSEKAEEADHGSWWDRGGGTLVGAGFSALGAAAGIAMIVTAFTPVGWFALASVGMLSLVAVAGTAIGTWQLSTSGRRTAAENEQLSADVNSGLSLVSSPITLGAGLAGAAYGGREMMDKATFYAGLGEAGFGLLKGLGKVGLQSYRFSKNLKSGMDRSNALFKVFGTDKIPNPNPAAAAKRPMVYRPGQARPPKYTWVHKWTDAVSNSHWISKHWAKEMLATKYGQRILAYSGKTVDDLVNKLEHPLNIKVVWREMHLRFDSMAEENNLLIPRLPKAVQQMLRPPNYIHESIRSGAQFGQTSSQHSYGN